MFKFKLETVLKYKIRLEEEAVKEYKLKKKEILECEHRIEDLNKKLENSKKESKKKLDINMMRIYANYIHSLESSIEKERQLLNTLLSQLKIIEEKMFEAKKERKILEKLKEKKYMEYLREENLKDQKFLDEIASIAENRKKLN